MDDLRDAIDHANEAWTGCCWRTEFGPLRLDLDGTRSRHAALLAAATRGEEAEQWKAAARWLSLVEADARSACQRSRQAIEFAERGETREASRWLAMAATLQGRYPMVNHYQLCRDRFESFIMLDFESKGPGRSKLTGAE
jgi:hypothetical protein